MNFYFFLCIQELFMILYILFKYFKLYEKIILTIPFKNIS